MAITITTLNDSATTPAANTFVEVAKDRTSAEWINTTQSTSTLDGRFIIKQTLAGKSRTGVPIRRTLVQSKFTAPTSVVVGGNTLTINEECTVNLTITTPVGLATLTTKQRTDLVAFIKDFATNANINALVQGQV